MVSSKKIAEVTDSVCEFVEKYGKVTPSVEGIVFDSVFTLCISSSSAKKAKLTVTNPVVCVCSLPCSTD